MKALFVLLFVATFFTISAAAQTTQVSGTWSGSWVPKGGVRDAVTVELKQDAGSLSGKFLTPVPMDFSKASFNAKTGIVAFEAVDGKSGKLYKVNGKIEGTELKGTLAVGDVMGDVQLIKWTYVPR